jgi:hypothetical protein
MRLTARSMFYALSLAASLAMVACGGGGGSGDDDGDDDVPPEGDHHTYVVDQVNIPITSESAEEFGFDLDSQCGAELGDEAVDNQLGAILSALSATAGSSLNLQDSIDKSVDSGQILLLADIQATSLDSASNAGLRLFQGSNPTPAACTDPEDPLTCGQHLQGTGSFTAAAQGSDQYISGTISGGRFSGGPGEVTLQIAFGDTPISLPLIEAHAEITGITDNNFGGTGVTRVGGAVRNEIVQTQIIPAVHIAVAGIIAEDCAGATVPDCTCTPDSTGETIMGIFDDDDDCAVTEEEIRNDSLIVTLLRPDVDTDCDGSKDSLSVGVGATAIKGTFTVP